MKTRTRSARGVTLGGCLGLLAAAQFTLPAQEAPALMALQQAEQFFGSNQAPRALALLANVLRNDLSNHLAAERLLAALSQRSFPRLLDVSNAPPQPPFSGKLPRRSPEGERIATALAGNRMPQ